MASFAGAYTNTYIHSPIKIPEGADILSNSFSAVNFTPNTSVYFNGKFEGYVGIIKSFNISDFNAQYEWRRWEWRRWNGTNTIKFDKSVENDEFNLSVVFKDHISGTGELCRNDNNCKNGLKCIERNCCGEKYPIKFSIPSTESCGASSIAIHPETLCSASVPRDTPIDFYLGNKKLRSNCPFSGDEGWYLAGVGSQCEVKIPGTFAVGTYPLKAVYSLKGGKDNYSKTYTELIEPNFKIMDKCSTSAVCNHGGHMNAMLNVNFFATEYRTDHTGLHDYIIPINAKVKIKNIGTFTGQCSDGATVASRLPGVLVWVYNNLKMTETDNILFNGKCKLPFDRRNYIGPTSKNSGSLPFNANGGVCDITWNKFGTTNSVSVGNLNVAGNYVIYVDYINAVCDSPDYICPDLFSGRTQSTCRIGTMSSVSSADGFKPVTKYTLEVVNPILKLTKTPSYHQENYKVRQEISVENIGYGDILVHSNSLPGLQDLDYSLASIPLISENQKKDIYATFSLKNVKKIHKNNFITSQGVNQLISETNYSEFNLSSYENYKIDKNGDLIVYYNLPNPLSYDDAYGFKSIPPKPLINRAKFNFTFSCNMGNHYLINLRNRTYSCISDAYWSNMDWSATSNADVLDSVNLVYTNTQLMPGSSIVFEVYAKEGDKDVGIRTKSLGNALKGVVGIHGNVYTSWDITQKDIDKVKGYNYFYFKVNGKRSGLLKIRTISSDAPMSIAIKNIKCGSYFNEGSTVNITIDANDTDNYIFGNVVIGKTFFNFSNGVYSFKKTFNSPGNIKVITNAVNNRGKKYKSVLNIMILSRDKNGKYIDRKYIAACINSPKPFSSFSGPHVSFDASATRGINIVNGVLHKLIPGKDKFSWYWRFMPSNMERNYINTTEQIAYKFTAEFPIPGNNFVTLRVGI